MTYRLMDGIKFLKSLPDKSVDGIFTDPPWGFRVSESSTGHRTKKGIIRGNENWLELIKGMTDQKCIKPVSRDIVKKDYLNLMPDLQAIRELNMEGIPILASTRSPYGVYYGKTQEEMNEYLANLGARMKAILDRMKAVDKIKAREFIKGQMELFS